MSYLVLARKYRPMQFSAVIGQEHVVRTLHNAIKLNRVHHAFLFTGARGVGKTTTARLLARALNCENGPTTDPCDQCASCKEAATGHHPDVLEIDGASNTGVDSIRELRETIGYMPSRGRSKLYIIDEAHMLSQAAFNALLKTLEEPPAHVKFIFATTAPQKIPVTIISRCQRFDFRRVSIEVLVAHLQSVLHGENITMSEGAVMAIAREAQGSVRDALSLLDQVLNYAGDDCADEHVLEALGVVDRQTVFELWDAIFLRNPKKVLARVAKVDGRGHDLTDLAGLLVTHLRDATVAKVLDDPGESLRDRSPGEIQRLKTQVASVSSADLHRLFGIMVHIAEAITHAPYPRVSLEMGLLRLMAVEPSTSIDALLKRIDCVVQGNTSAASPTQALATPSPKSSLTQPSKKSTPAPTHEAWATLVNRVRDERPALASVLEHGRVLTFTPERVQIGFPAGTFFWESAKDQSNKVLLQRMLAEQLGQPVVLEFLAIDASDTTAAKHPPSLAQSAEAKKQRAQEDLQHSARQHPAVQSATRILDGTLEKIESLGKDSSYR